MTPQDSVKSLFALPPHASSQESQLSEQLVVRSLRARSVFDREWSNDYFSISDSDRKATFQQGSSVSGFADYNQFPCVRVKQSLEEGDSVTFKISQYGWSGLGDASLPPHGFPGYLPHGLMLRNTNGGIFYNGNALGTVGFPLVGKVTLTYQHSIRILVVHSEGQACNFVLPDGFEPKFFVFSVPFGFVEIVDD